MGVRGLTTFIKNNEKKYLKPHKLHNCTILLDGNGVASNLFIWSNIDSAFGGDYDKFAKYVKEFFKVLNKCKIKPLVLFDGGYEQRKLRTVYSRLKDKYKSARGAQPFSGSVTFPLFMRIVFREVLVELNIPFAQSDFEADDELAALARQLGCPVLSNDSDFYIYDVLYIPLPSLELTPIKFNDSQKDSSSEQRYYIPCKIYNLQLFIESFGGLEKNMLPLLATLLGNDYIKRSVFNAFYANLRIPKGKSNPLQRRIQAVIDWLRNESFETATRKILGRMKKRKRSRVMGQLKKVVQGYVTCTSILCDYLDTTNTDKTRGKLTVDANIMNIINSLDENIDTLDDNDIESIEQLQTDVDELNECSDEVCSNESDNGFTDDESAKEKEIEDTPSFNEDHNNIPNWLLDFARRGRIHSCVIDILSLRQYFCPPQVEDYSLTPSHYISLPFLNFIVGILLGDSEQFFRYWTRNNSSLVWYNLEPSCKTSTITFPPCDEILSLSDSTRRNALLEITGVNIELSCLPDEWHLFVIAAVFWLKNMEDPVVSEAHFHTLMMCLVAIYTVDSKIGVHRNKQTFSRKYKTLLNKLIESRSKGKEKLTEIKVLTSDKFDVSKDTYSPKNELNQVLHEDCVLFFDSILPFHHLNDNIKAKPKLFCSFTIHAFAQFQSCLFHLMVLNSIMGFPLKEPVISQLYSGVFVYNMFSHVSKKTNIVACMESLFQNAPSLLRLYKSLTGLLQVGIELPKNSIKSHKKKRRNKEQLKLLEDTEGNEQEQNDELFFDDNNMFSRLSINA